MYHHLKLPQMSLEHFHVNHITTCTLKLTIIIKRLITSHKDGIQLRQSRMRFQPSAPGRLPERLSCNPRPDEFAAELPWCSHPLDVDFIFGGQGMKRRKQERRYCQLPCLRTFQHMDGQNHTLRSIFFYLT